MMRLRERDLQTVYLKKHIATTDGKGNTKINYSDLPVELKMNIQAAGGSINAQIYGEKLSYMKTAKYQGDLVKEGQNEKDGVCVFVSKESQPDFKITAIQTYSTHLNITLERL